MVRLYQSKSDTTNCYGNAENLRASRIYHIPTTLLLLPKCMPASQNFFYCYPSAQIRVWKTLQLVYDNCLRICK